MATTSTNGARHRSYAGRWGFAHVPALDGLRGAAVAAVLLYHAGHLDGGYLGVDLFFVLSGFLITSLLLAEHRSTGGIGLGAFWVRRARRLLPAALVLLVGVSAYGWLLARPVDLEQIRADGLATLFYVANWHTIWRGSSYWDLSLAPSPLQHTWSLAIEEQFYLLWPLAVAFVARRADDLRRAVGRIAVVLAAVSAALFVGLHAAGASDTRIYEGTDTRAVALLLGVALAAHRERLVAWLAPRALEAIGLGAAVVLGVMWVLLDGQSRWVYRGGLPLASLLGVVVIAAASAGASPVLGRVFAVAPLRWLGLISYGLYLWHWPVYVALDQRNGTYPGLGDLRLEGAGLLAAKLSLSLLAALVSYRLVERPIRRGALAGRVGLGAALGGVAVTAVIIVVATAGAVDAPEGPETGGEVEQAQEVVAGAPTVLIAGDSVGLSIADQVVRDPERYGVNPINAAVPGCSQVAQGRQAKSFVGQEWSPIACVPNPVTESDPDAQAVLLYVGARPNDFIVVDGQEVRACDPAFDRVYVEVHTEMLRTLTDGGTLPSAVAQIPRSGEFALPAEGADERIACVNRLIEEVAAAVPNAHVINTGAFVCPGESGCREEIDGEPLRSDGVHYDQNEAGARVTDWIIAQLLDLTGLRPAG
ncbi:MAG TPA: acyltransferase family protein [Iamia sp.]|nr:acyltransferase family protein [Iamia sp.]